MAKGMLMRHIGDLLNLPSASVLPAIQSERGVIQAALQQAFRRRERALFTDEPDATIIAIDDELSALHRDLERVDAAERVHLDPTLLGVF